MVFESSNPSKISISRNRLIFVSCSIFAILFISTCLFCLVWFKNFLLSFGLTPQIAYQIIFQSGVSLRNDTGRTNILLMGVGGDSHEGGQLTDTLLILSFTDFHSPIGLLSIPRDIWSDTLKDKINSAYYYGEQKEIGGGKKLLSEVIKEITGLQIHYTVLIDFSGFEKLIDLIGGLDVHVEKGFIDREFPIAGKENDSCNGDTTYRCRYVTVSFNSGIQHMNGETALTYVRSRHAEGEEGTDFARGKRQQEIVLAFRQKLLKFYTWLTPSLVIQIYELFFKTVRSDLNIAEMFTIGKLIVQIPYENIRRIDLSGELTMGIAAYYGGRYVLVPKMSLVTIHNFILHELTK